MAQKKREHWEQRFKETADLLPGIVCEMDLTGRVTYANNFAFQSFKYTEDDLEVGIFLDKLLHPEDMERAKRNIADILTGANMGPQEYRLVHKDNSVSHYEVASTAILDGDQVCGLRTCIFDISERFKAQKKLAASEARFRRMYRESPIPVALFNQEGLLMDGNAAFQEMFFIGDSAPVPLDFPTLFALVNLSDDERAQLSTDSVYRYGGEFDLGAFNSHDGVPDMRYLEWYISPFRESDEGKDRLLAQVLDVTERRRAEEAKLEEARLAAQSAKRLVESLREEVREKFTFKNMVSRCTEMRNIFDSLPPIAESATTVHISGESGTGKELIARAVHSLGPRKRKPFVAINCSALPDNLLESELFGYKAGAFTDAKKDKPGKFALAEKGVIFLDEIGDISPAMQVKLLRVLQEKTYEPLGDIKSIRADVQVLTATHRDLATMVKEGTFRKDLFYRMNIVKIKLPSLKERRSDIPLLCDHFIQQFNRRFDKSITGVSQAVLDRLLVHEFDGNIRELENIIEHAFVFCKSGDIQLMHLPEELAETPNDEVGRAFGAFSSLDELEAQYLRAILQETGGSRVAAAKKLGIHKSTLFRKLKKFGITGE